MEMDIKCPLVTVYTCVYNMADKIHRVFESMQALTYPNVEHIIVNDGSTDDLDDKVQDYMAKVSYPVIYVKKENGGKHTALNVAWDKANGEFLLGLDADDSLLPHSVEFLVETFYKIPEEDREKYWCVHGRCQTECGEFIGDKYPENINALNWEEAQKLADSISGEKVGLKKSSVVKGYRFPEPVGVKMVAEDIIWKQVNKRYRTWYTNEVVRTYWVNEGGSLSGRGGSPQWFANKTYTQYLRIKSRKNIYYGNLGVLLLKYAMTYTSCTKVYKKMYPYYMDFDGYEKFLASLFYLPGLLAGALYRLRNQ